MSKRPLPIVDIRFDDIVGGGQAIGTLPDGMKVFAWGGLKGELASVQLNKKKRNFAEGTVIEVLEPSTDRIPPKDESSYLSTSPWQIMSFEAEQRHKAQLIEEAFALHHVALPSVSDVYSDDRQFEYRNKVEFSFWWDTDRQELDLAFFKRGSHGKIPVQGTSLAMPVINQAAVALRDVLRARGDEAFNFKTVIIRASQNGSVVTQLYTKTSDYLPFSVDEIKDMNVNGFELIYSDPRSPASVITKRLQSHGNVILSDDVAGIPFTYAADSFFQVNIPVYEQALVDIKRWVNPDRHTIDFYSGVGSLGLSVAPGELTLVEVNETAVHEANMTIRAIGRQQNARAIHSPSEHALEYISREATVIVDPPRAGLHEDVVRRLLRELPPRIIYLSCNPVTQARDVSMLMTAYDIESHRGYNFFPRTPHIEHLVVLDAKP